jgi:hypothetical protein
MTSTTRSWRRLAAAAVATLVAVIAATGIAVGNGNHSTHSDTGGGIPWFPIVVGGLLLLMLGIMVVRRLIETDDGDDEADPEEA